MTVHFPPLEGLLFPFLLLLLWSHPQYHYHSLIYSFSYSTNSYQAPVMYWTLQLLAGFVPPL
jgi:hypothetical protein